MKRVPVNLISGPLGVGKTTAIRHLLENRLEGERWAVLVNEFGLVGLDAALLANAARPKGIEVREVAGGCISRSCAGATSPRSHRRSAGFAGKDWYSTPSRRFVCSHG